MMSDAALQLTAHTRRPKRLLSKTSDDNVLGISWKEERELRRAIYVSLRDQHSTPSLGRAWVMSKLRARGSSHTSRMRNPRQVISTGTYLLRRCRQGHSSCPEGSVTTPETTNTNATVMAAASSTLRRAKIRATARLNGIASPPGRPSSPNWGFSSTIKNNGCSAKTSKTTKAFSTPRTVRSQFKKNASARPLRTTASSNSANSSSSVGPTSPRRSTPWRLKKSLWTVNPDAQSARTRGSSRCPSLMMNASNGLKADYGTLSSTPNSRRKRLAVSTAKSTFRKNADKQNARVTVAATTRNRPNETTLGRRKANRLRPSGASAKNKLAKKLVSAAAAKTKTALSRKNRSTKVPEKAPASVETVTSKSGTAAVVRPDRKLSFNGDNRGELPPTVKRPPPLVPAELCQDPDGQPVSVHDFIEFVCYHGTPCLSPRLAWFSEPRTIRTCPAVHGSCSAGKMMRMSSKLNEHNSPNAFVSRACIATATQPKRNSELTSTLPITCSVGINGPLFKTEEPVPSPILPILTTTTTKSPKVLVAKKMASVNQVPSFHVPQSDLFDMLSRSKPDQIDCILKQEENNSHKPSSNSAGSTALRLNKNGATKESSRRAVKPQNRSKPGRLVRR